MKKSSNSKKKTSTKKNGQRTITFKGGAEIIRNDKDTILGVKGSYSVTFGAIIMAILLIILAILVVQSVFPMMRRRRTMPYQTTMPTIVKEGLYI